MTNQTNQPPPTLDFADLLDAAKNPDKLKDLAKLSRKKLAKPSRRSAPHIAGETHPFIEMRTARAPAAVAPRCVGPDQQVPPHERERSDRMKEDRDYFRDQLHAERAKSRFLTQLFTAG